MTLTPASRATPAATGRPAGVEFLGRVDDRERDRLLEGARALLFPGEEDFGIVPVEAQAAGVPVIAYGVGGARESVIDGQTGVLFDGQAPDDVVSGIERFEQLRLDPDRMRENAARFGRERFRREMAEVIDHLIATDDSDMHVMQMLRGDDFQSVLVDEAALESPDPDLLAGPFAHIVVDEAQELTDAEWQMLLLRCPSRSFTIVGDRAQARHGFTESWPERLERIGFDQIRRATLSINYRTPEEVMAEAEPIIRAVLPDANVPTSIRSSGVPVVHGAASELGSILDTWLAAHADGIACVIGDPTFQATSRVRSLAPELSKGLEFDLVVLIDPEAFGMGIEGAVDRYVAMTRGTQQLVILTSS